MNDKLSFLWFCEDGAGRHQTFESENNVALFFFIELRRPMANSHASLRAHRSCLDVSSWDR